MRFLHPILFWHPILVGLWVSMGFLCLGMSQVMLSIDRSGQLHRTVTAAAAELAAEEAAFALASGTTTHRTLSGFSCELEGTSTSPMRILVRDRFDTEHRFECDLLPGAMPPIFGQPFTLLTRSNPDPTTRLHSVSSDPPVTVARDQWAWTDPMVEDLPPDDWSRAEILHRDASVALRRLPAGTDRPDYTLGKGGDVSLTPTVPASGVVRVDGNLWVDRGAKPLVLQLDEDLTIVIRGNLYLGRSLQVRGRGRLVLSVNRWRGEMFRDLDFSGRWSQGDELLSSKTFQGPIEGTGTVYLGLPADNPIPNHLRVDAAVVVDGEVHIRSPRTEVWGALAVGHGVTGSPDDNVLLPLGILLPDTHRERIPGFQSQGSPRPGILRRL